MMLVRESRFSRTQTKNFLLLTEVIYIKLYVPSVGFSVAGLDRPKFGFYQFQSCLFIVVIVISILLKPTF